MIKTFGTFLKSKRIEMGLKTQAELSKKTNLSTGHIGRIERDEGGRINLQTVISLARALNCIDNKDFFTLAGYPDYIKNNTNMQNNSHKCPIEYMLSFLSRGDNMNLTENTLVPLADETIGDYIYVTNEKQPADTIPTNLIVVIQKTSSDFKVNDFILAQNEKGGYVFGKVKEVEGVKFVQTNTGNDFGLSGLHIIGKSTLIARRL